MILVACATGRLGVEICRRLRASGYAVRGLVREGAPRENTLCRLGVQVVHGDFRDPASLGMACRGADTVISPALCIVARRPEERLKTVDHDGQLALLDAARRANVRRYVYISVDPRLPEDIPFVRATRDLEWAVRTSGLGWTILQPGPLMDVWMSPALGWDAAAGRARIFGRGTVPVDYVSLQDVAEIAVRALGNEDAERRLVPLLGPEPVSPLQAVRIFEEETGTRFKVEHVPLGVLWLMSGLLRPFDPIHASLLALEAATTHRDDVRWPDLPPGLCFPLTTVRDFARRTATALCPRESLRAS